MFVYMQAYVEIILVAILVVILFNGSITGLKDFANSVLGKAFMVCLIIFISHQFGTNAGLLMAAITVVLLNQNLEGFGGKEGIAPATKDSCKEGDYNCSDAKYFGSNASPVSNMTQSSSNGDKKPDAPFSPKQSGSNGSIGKIQKKNMPVEGKKKKEEEEKEKEEKKIEPFSNYTLDNAADYTNLGSTLAAYSTNDNIMTSMRASEYAKTAPGGSALMTNHMDTVRVVNNPRSEGIF